MGRKWKQGSEYSDTGEEVVEVEGAQGHKISPVLLVGGLAALVVVVVLLVVLLPRSKGEVKPPEDPVSTEDILGGDAYWDQFEAAFSYTAEEIVQLRAWGYTGDEIESNALSEVPTADLINASKRLQEETRATLSNPESPEYQALLNNTWLGQAAIALPVYEKDVTESALMYTSRTLNADYTKVPAHGRNLFLKVFLEDGAYVFMECPVIRYMQLPDSGNIVVSYMETSVGGTLVVSGMSEVVVQ